MSLFWASAAMKLDLVSSNYEVYLGPNVSSVVGLAKMSESEWFYSRMPWRSKEFKVSPPVTPTLKMVDIELSFIDQSLRERLRWGADQGRLHP